MNRAGPLGADYGTGHLEDIFTDMSSVKHNRISNPYAAGTQMQTLL